MNDVKDVVRCDLTSEELCDVYHRFQREVPEIVERASFKDPRFALITIKSFDGQDLSSQDRRYVIRKLCSVGEPLAGRFEHAQKFHQKFLAS